LPRDEKLVRSLFKQAVDGLEYLHNEGIAHLDIKPANFLIGGDYKLKYCDFDGSFVAAEDNSIDGCGTRNYRAPEMRDSSCRDPFAADIYSLGIFLFVLLAQVLPYFEDQEVNGLDLFKMLHTGDNDFWLAHEMLADAKMGWNDEFKKLFLGMVCYDPKQRWSLK